MFQGWKPVGLTGKRSMFAKSKEIEERFDAM